MDTSQLTGADLVLECSDKERRAIKMVRMFISLLAVVAYKERGPGYYSIGVRRLHEHFPQFMLSIGVVGAEYEINESRICPAIDLYIRALMSTGDGELMSIGIRFGQEYNPDEKIRELLETADKLCVPRLFRDKIIMIASAAWGQMSARTAVT